MASPTQRPSHNEEGDGAKGIKRPYPLRFRKEELVTRRVLVLGAGNQGQVIAKALSSQSSVEQVTVVDIDEKKLGLLAGTPKTFGFRADVRGETLRLLLKNCDLVSGALPSELGFHAMKEAIDAGVDMVDTSFMQEDPLVLNALARKNEVSVVPDCGVAPGLSHILVGHHLSVLKAVEGIHIMVGGLPQSPKPPLGYVVTWSVRDLIEEYMRPARIIRGKTIISVDPLSESNLVDVPGLGKLESFYSDGLRTLLHTVPDVESMDERTLRYPGHVDKIRVLKDCGMFNKEPLFIEGCRICPRDVTAEILSRVLSGENEKDLTILVVSVSGKENGRRVTLTGQLLDHYDERTQFSSMARSTAFTNTAVCNLLLTGQLKEKGIIPPETLGMNAGYFGKIVDYLQVQGICIEEKEYVD